MEGLARSEKRSHARYERKDMEELKPSRGSLAITTAAETRNREDGGFWLQFEMSGFLSIPCNRERTACKTQ
jgi:hypothetical protein